MKTKKINIIHTVSVVGVWAAASFLVLTTSAFANGPVPGYVAPLTVTKTPDYADDTRGIFVPSHAQHRMKTYEEMERYKNPYGAKFQLASADYTGPESLVADAYSDDQVMEQELNRISNGYAGYPDQMQQMQPATQMQPMQPAAPSYPQQPTAQPSMPQQVAVTAQQPVPMQTYTAASTGSTGGVEIARGQVQRKVLDMQNGIVRLREDRISVRRALQRMMDQIGGGEWTIIWDMAEQNAALPDTEISLYAEEPFMNVMNALLARIQTRSGQPLRVIRYDNTQRLIITDRAGGHRMMGKASAVGVGDVDDVAVTETVLKEAMVSLHYDEVPLVDALENLVNQAGRGEWRLRVYAGLDQVLKPAHIEEPFNVALERILKLFNLKYEIFPGGKLVVVTHNNRLGYNGVQ